MKKLVLVGLFLTLTMVSAFSQTASIDRLVHQVKKANRGCEKTDLNIPGWLIRFGANFVDDDDLDGVDIKLLGKKISHLRIVSIDGKKNVDAADFQTFLTDIKQEGFEDLMTVRSNGDDIRFMVREKKDFIRNIVLVVNEKSEGGDFVLLSLEGKFTMEDINKMMKDVTIDVNNKKGKKSSKVKTVNSED